MIRTMLVVSSVCVAVAFASPARAGDASGSCPGDVARDGAALDLSLKLGARGFRLGGTLSGLDGLGGGAWLSGEARPDGFRLDGRVEHGGRTHRFRFDADLDAWLGRGARAWGVTDL
jgi:hypothetical protein